MSRSILRRGFSALTLALLLTTSVTACGDDDASPDGDAVGDATGDPGTDGGDDDVADGSNIPADLCAVISSADVEAIIGEANVVSETTPSGGCSYTSDDARGLHPTLEIAPDHDDAGGIAGARQGAEATLGAAGEDLTVAGSVGYFVTGELSGFNSTQAGAASSGALITLSMLGEAASTKQTEAAALLELAVAVL